MTDSQSPLLSIIIPTKNRQYTCLYAIESVLLLNKEDIEIIVQDCSDSDTLKQQIVEKFQTDTRINYEYTDTKPSMTDNWNRAFERASGLYKCGIGDDDVVLPNIYDIAVWAKENDIDAVGHSKKYAYFWPDYTILPEYASKLILINPNTPKGVKIFCRRDLDKLLKAQATTPDMNYRNLPMAYHCLLASSLITSVIKKSGKFLDATSLDVYSAFALGLLVREFYVYDIPFTLPGACGSSNSNRAVLKSFNTHFSEFKKIVPDKRIPEIYNLTFTIAESTQKAFANFNNTKYPPMLDLPFLYVQFMAYSFKKEMFEKLFTLMKANKFRVIDYLRFFVLLTLKLFKDSIYVRFKILLKKIIKIKEKNLLTYEAKNIQEAVDILKGLLSFPEGFSKMKNL